MGEVVYYNDEFYWCKYKCRDADDKLIFGEFITRVKWKTWEYNYGSANEVIDTPQKAKESMDRLEQWHSKIRTAIQQADSKEKELLEQEQSKNNTS